MDGYDFSTAAGVLRRVNDVWWNRPLDERHVVWLYRKEYLKTMERLARQLELTDDVTDDDRRVMAMRVAYAEKLLEDQLDRKRAKTRERVRRFRERKKTGASSR